MFKHLHVYAAYLESFFATQTSYAALHELIIAVSLILVFSFVSILDSNNFALPNNKLNALLTRLCVLRVSCICDLPQMMVVAAPTAPVSMVSSSAKVVISCFSTSL